jgi:threonine dehydrogenase-like Zn-dependent dehydrogenase
MKALCFHSKKDVRVNNVADPKIMEPTDVIIKVTATAICGSDLHIYNGILPHMKEGDILGHEFMGEVIEVGKAVKKIKLGDRIVVPFDISCGDCYFCNKKLFSLCDHSNPNAEIARKEMGQSPAGCFGYSHMLGGYAGGQAEFVRVPFADIGPVVINSNLKDEQVLFLSDIFPTGYMAAENCEIERGETVAVWGCGPVGQFAMQSAWMLGAGRVIGIDSVPERLKMAKDKSGAEIINLEDCKVFDALMELTEGRGPDRCIDAVGTEAHGIQNFDAMLDEIKVAVHISSDRAQVIRDAIMCCRKGGTISIPGVYLGKLDNIPMGPAMNKGLTFKMGQTHVQRYLNKLLKKIENKEIDPSFVITHKLPLQDAAEGYKLFNEKKDGCIKIFMTP